MAAEVNIASIFWTASLNALETSSGRVPFSDLWPKGRELRKTIRTCMDLDTKLLRKLAMYVTRTCIWNVLETLIDLGAIRVSVRCSSGRSLLHLTCVLDNLEGVRLLLAKRADVYAVDDAGELPIWYARDMEIVRILSNVMKQQQIPGRPTIHRVASVSTNDEDRRKQEIESLFFLIKSVDQRFPFEDIAMKIKNTAPQIFTAVDEVSGDMIIHAAVRAGVIAVPLIVLLVQHYKICCNKLNAHGESPLIIAVRQGSLDVADLLMVCFGGDTNLAGSDGYAPIHVACMNDNPDAVLLLLRRGANLCNSEGIFADDVVGVGPTCHEIIRQAKYDRMELLLNIAADTSVTPSPSNTSELNGVTLCVGDFKLCDDEGNTCLMLPSAVLNKHFVSTALHVIVSNLPDMEKRSKILNARNPGTGKTALAIASRLGNVDIVRSLMSAGASPAIADKENLLPVHHALMSGDLATAGTLFDNDSGLTGFEQSFQLVANRQEALAVVREAFVRRQEHIVQPLLIEAALKRSTDGLADHLEPSDIIDISTISQEATDAAGQSPVFIAVENGAVEVVKFFVERGVNVAREQPVTGDSLLHVAVRSGQSEMVDYLLGLDACHDFLEHLNCSGQSALHVAALTGLKPIVDKLLRAGASPILDEAAGFPPITSPYQSIQLCLDKARRDRSLTVVETLRGATPSSPAPGPAQNKVEQIGSAFRRMSRTDRYLSAASSLLLSVSAPRASMTVNPDVLKRASLTQSLSSHRLSSAENVTYQRPSMTQSLQPSSVHHEHFSIELPSFIQLFDFYLYAFDGEPLLTAVVRQRSIPLVEHLLSHYRQVADEFTQAAVRRVVAFSTDPIKQEQDSGRQSFFSSSAMITPKRTELIHPCLLKSPRNGATALHVAIHFTDDRELIFMLANACEASLCVTDANGLTPLQMAVMLSRPHAVSVFLKFSTVDLDCVSPDGRTLEQLATSRRILQRLRQAQRLNSQTDEDDASSLSDSLSSSSAASGPTWQSRRRSTIDNDDSLSFDEDIETTSLANGMSRKNLRRLYRSLDFVGVMNQYNEIQKNFAAENIQFSESGLETQAVE